MKRLTAMRGLAAAALLAFTASAYAGGPLRLCYSQPIKYVGVGSVTLNYDQGNLGSRTKAQIDALVTEAISLWTNVGTSTVTLGRGADLPADVTTSNYTTYLDNFSDGLSPVVYDTDGSIIDTLFGVGAKNSILGFAGSTGYNYSCQYAEGRALINGYNPVSDTTMKIVVAHEVGHLIGLDHTQLDDTQGLLAAYPSNYPLMYPIAYRDYVSLHEDDIAAVSALYADATLNSVYGQLTGSFTQTNGTPIRGANIWAMEVSTNKVYSIVSDYLKQNTGYFKLLLPPGTYTLRAEAIQTGFTGGSSVGPYSETLSGLSFQPPLYNSGVAMAPIALGGSVPAQFAITAACGATATFKLDGTGSVSGNCNSGSTGTTTNLLLNPGFEGGNTGWVFSPYTLFNNAQQSHTGSQYVWFGGIDNANDYIYQDITIPTNAQQAYLQFWYQIGTNETTVTTAYDTMAVRVLSLANVPLSTLVTLSNLNATTGWVQSPQYAVSAYKGQTIRLNFAAITDTLKTTSFLVDDVSLTVVTGTGSSLLDHYYTSILGRAPDAGGKTYWDSEAARMQSLGVDIKEAFMVMAGNFFNSTEYLSRGRTDQQYVTDLYATFFNRAPDAGGLSYWMSQLSGGSTRNLVMYFFLFSPEFNTYMTGLFGNTASRAEVYAVIDFYRGILDRLPDNGGYNYWLGRFRTAQCSGSAAIVAAVDNISSLFISSAEFAARNRTNAQYVQDLYYAFMRRSAAPSEVNYWINTLNTGTQTRNQLRLAFLGSPEFQGRVNAIIAQGCLP